MLFNKRKNKKDAVGFEGDILYPNELINSDDPGNRRSSFFEKIIDIFRLRKLRKAKDKFEKMLAALRSKARHQEAGSVGYCEATNIKGAGYSKQGYESYESVLLDDGVEVDVACAEYHGLPFKSLVVSAERLITFLRLGSRPASAQVSPDGIASQIELMIVRKQNQADSLIGSYKEAKHHLDHFKWANRRTTGARCPEKKQKIIWVILITMALVETLVNGFFLNTGFDLSMAFTVSGVAAFINVIGNALLGEGYRIVNHIEPEEAKKGKWYLISAIVLVLFINCLIGWYRYTLDLDDPDGSLLKSILFFVAGVGFGGFAFYEKYISDDPYPKYGRYSREVGEFVKSLSKMREEHVSECADLKQKANAILDGFDDEIRRTFNKIGCLVSDMTQKIKAWEVDREDASMLFTACF